MQIAKYGKIIPKRIICCECEAVLFYAPQDVQTTDGRGKSYSFIVCPVCGQKTCTEKEVHRCD